MNAMTFARALAFAAVIATAPAVAAYAQTPWPDSRPQGQQSPWPSSTPQPQPQQSQPQPGQTPWPASAPQPQQAPWPASAPPGQPMASPAGPPMGGPGMGGPGMGAPTAAQQECVAQFQALRGEVEKRGVAAKAGNGKQVAREELCKLVTAYSAAETKWVKYAEANMTKCGIPKPIITQLKTVHAKTADAQKKICAAGPAGGPAAAPTLSDALGTVTLPTRETEKRKSGGTLDTLTGPAIGR